jgi:hypothetical protein
MLTEDEMSQSTFTGPGEVLLGSAILKALNFYVLSC